MDKTYDRLERALDHPDRLKLYTMLLQNELCGCELEQLFEVSRDELERHLTVLEESGLLEHRVEDSQLFYQARSNPVREVREWVLRNADELNWNELSRLTRRTKRANLCESSEPRYAPTA